MTRLITGFRSFNYLQNNVALAKSEIMKGGTHMLSKCYPYPDGGPDALKPDAYDAEGKLTINSWDLFMREEIDRENDE